MKPQQPEIHVPIADLTSADIADRQFVERVVRNVRNTGMIPRYRWGLVKDAFGCGSTVAHELCRRFGVDPDEEVLPHRSRLMACEGCSEEVWEQCQEADEGAVPLKASNCITWWRCKLCRLTNENALCAWLKEGWEHGWLTVVILAFKTAEPSLYGEWIKRRPQR